jgi:predicted  nucleic acid-binding Zn-ribbon protein
MNNVLHKPLLAAVLGLAATLSLAQGTAGKTATFGNAKAGAKLLSYDALKLCLKQRDDLGQRKPKLEAERAKLDSERAELLQIDEALKADRAKVDKLNETAADIVRRGKELSQQVADFNERVARFDAAPPSGPTGERQRRALERDKAALDKAATDLEAERAAVGPNAEQLVKTYQARAAQRDAAAADWNTRNGTLAKSVSTYEDELANWKSDCEGRPYREDDEKDILGGK